jgi:hypothetical protein
MNMIVCNWARGRFEMAASAGDSEGESGLQGRIGANSKNVDALGQLCA